MISLLPVLVFVSIRFLTVFEVDEHGFQDLHIQYIQQAVQHSIFTRTIYETFECEG